MPAVDIAIRLNGVERRLHIDARTLLLDVLREHLGLTGAFIVITSAMALLRQVWAIDAPCRAVALDVGAGFDPSLIARAVRGFIARAVNRHHSTATLTDSSTAAAERMGWQGCRRG